MYKNLYSKITDALVNDGYIIVTDALDEKFSPSLKQFAINEKDFAKACISGKGDLHLDNAKRRDKTQWLEPDGGLQSDFLGFADGLRDYLNRELYLGLSYYESHFAIYEEGDFYETHLDCFQKSKNRVVTTVYYLNEEWDDSDGGELVVYDSNNNFLAKITPKANTFIAFMSEKFPHEVLPTKKTRYSIAGWFRIDKKS